MDKFLKSFFSQQGISLFNMGYNTIKNILRNDKENLTVYLDELTTQRRGYVMKNYSNGVEIDCTDKFVNVWEARGFSIIEEKPITLLNLQ